MNKFCWLTYRIPFSETDAMGIVHHSNHPKYMERGRVEFLRLIDLNYTEIVKRGFHFPLTGLKISFKKPLYFDDIILIETAVMQVSKIRMVFDYRIFGINKPLDPQLSATSFDGVPSVLGETYHCCVNEKGRPVEIEESMFQKFSALGAK